MKLVPTELLPKETIYQIKITLHEGDPEIWRRVLVVGTMSLYKLHHIIQIAMGWTNSHLHEFEISGRRYINPDHDPDDFDQEHPRAISVKKVKLCEIAAKTKSFEYRYDFGDGWRHKVEIEKVFKKNEIYHYPVCVDGAGACPPEDCGGMGGYGELIEQIKDKQHEEHCSTMRWLGGQFDPNSFDANRVNRDGLWKRRW